MSDFCAHCGERLAEPALFCSRCGGRVLHPQEHAHLPAEKVAVGGAFSGLYLGLIALPLLLIFGIMLCLTGWGIVFGLPVIVLAILAPLAGPLFGLGVAKEGQGEEPTGEAAPPLR
ncbi:zinc ribbon domain-containing protein [Acidobacteria bacterium AB60]|nr:zinc ribbon domain-containing protein [Acidobacteria bacterium AB60]